MDFFNRYKTIFLIFGFIVITIGIGFAIFFVFFKPTISPIVETPEETGALTPGAGLPAAGPGAGIVTGPEETGPTTPGLPTTPASPVAQGGLTETVPINQAPSLDATLAKNGQDIQYYDRSDGLFYRIDKDGNAAPLSDQVFHDVQTVTWSPNKNEAILEYPDGANIVYNFDTGKQITLPAHWKDFDYSPTGGQIVMKSMGLDQENRWLAIASADGSKIKPIESLGDKDSTVYPSWSANNQIIAMYTEGVDFDRQEVFFVGQNNENFKSTIVEGHGFQPQWSPDGNELVYSVYSTNNEMKPSLWAVNASGDSIGSGRRNLGLETWADKCTFGGGSDMYCAVPDNLPEGAGLFPELSETTIDRLYKVDVSTGLKKLVAVPNGSFNMKDLMVTDNGYYLFFTDSFTGQIYKIKLK